MQKQQKREQSSQGPLKEGYEERSIEWLSRRLCTRQELGVYNQRKAYFKARKKSNVVLFPIWQRYRHQAIQIVRLRRAWPWLRYFPLKLSAVLVQWTNR